jgi:hypothetical protein
MSLNLRPPASGEQPGVKKLGRYECTEPLGGDGGFETYRGRVKGLTGLDRSFAVKVLRLKRSESASAVVEPFLQAAKRSAALANPRIATVVDTGAGDGVVFAVTPFMEGLDLSHFLAAARQAGLLVTGKDDRARQWYSLVAYVGAEIARGLHGAHMQTPPLIHGALCPGNVFITTRGAVRLLDFGLRAAVRRPFEPRPRRLLPYIAPELAAPAADGTMAGDMYSLGVLLGELASGDSPSQGRRASEIQILLSILPEDLGALIGRLVSVSPAARPSAEEAASLLTGSYADTNEAHLVAALASLVQHLVSNQAQSQVPADAEQEVDAAPPPPSEVESDEAFEASPPNRSPKPMGTPLAEIADLSVSDLEAVEDDGSLPAESAGFDAPISDVFTADPSVAAPGRPDARGAAPVTEERFSSDPTTIGDRSLIEDLLKRSRPTEPLSRPTASRPAATHLASPAEAPASAPPPRGPTQPGFSPTGTVAFQTPPPVPVAVPENTGFSSEFSAEPAAVAEEMAAVDSARIGLPVRAEAAPANAGRRENPQAESVAIPGLVGFEAPPATWGARALAALGGQAGIASVDESLGLGLLDEGLLDQVQSDPGSRAQPAPPALQAPDDGYLRSPQSLPMGELAMTRLDGPVDLGLVPEDPAAANELPFAEAQSHQGDGLLEDQLVDAPEGMHDGSSWSEADAPFGTADGNGMSAPDPLPFREAPSVEVAQVIASVVDPPSLPEAQAFLEEEGPSPAPATPAYFDDSGKPLDEPAPTSATARAPTIIGYGPPPVPAKPTSSAPPVVPSWAKSPEVQKQRSRPLVWGIAGMVLGASVALGGLAGFMVGTRGKSTPPVMGAMRASETSRSRAATEQADDEPSAESETAPAKPTMVPPGKSAATGKAPEAVKGREVVPSAKAPPATAAAAAKAMREPPEKALPADKTPKALTADKTPKPLPAAALGKGVGDAPGSGELVSVSVTSQPEGATVWINGKERGNTPLQVKIPSGPARVVMILAGHGLAAADMTASEGAKLTKQLTAIDPPLEGEARFRAECTTQGKLPIVIDGKETGVLCPFSKLRVDPGVHKIGLFVPALGAVHEKEVTLHPGVRSIVFAD